MLNEADTRAKLIDPKLKESGWHETQIQREYLITKGRVFLIGDEPERKERKKADYLLRYSDSFPLAVLEAKDDSHSPADGIQQAKGYAESLKVLFAYSSNGHGIEEFDFIANQQRSLSKFPAPGELLNRYYAHKFPEFLAKSQKAAEKPKKAYTVTAPQPSIQPHLQEDPLLNPYFKEPGRTPWYFQEIAIKNIIERILKGDKRILLTMATGTGKTLVAFQVTWKLYNAGRVRRVLFLADRNFLRSQAYNTFGPFEDARAIIEEGKAPKTRDIYFSIYQAMYSGEEPNHRLYQQYPSDFFDLIIIDECHRSGFGTWNAILDHFNSAIQLGMTATPKRDENIDTYNYFCQENNGNPAFTYSLGQGIEDGFLATYKVHKVKTNIDRDGLHIEDAKSQGAEIYCPEEVEPRDYYRMEQFEREIVLPDRTEKICAHLAMLLKTFDPTKKSMIFCVNADHARQVAKELQNRFSYLGFSNYAVPIIAEEPDSKTHYEQFQDSEKPAPVVATTVDLLSTGVDVPSVKNIVFIKPVGSKVVFKQIVGRGSRIDPITDKLWFRIVDYTNATRLFDDWDRPIPPPPPGPEGPRESYFQGVLLDEELYEPIPNGLVTVLIGPNEQVQARSNAFGIFGFVNLPEGEVKVFVRAEGFRPRQLTLRTVPDVQEKVLIELKQEKPPLEKIRIEGLIVNIAEETYLELEPTGQQLTVKEYIDHSRNFLLKSISHFSQLKKIWADPAKRKDLLANLKENSVYPKALASILKRPEADDFDILANVGFKQGLISREERATSFANLQQKFLDSYGPEAREVLEILLDKYRLSGIEEISPEIFRVAPFDKMGYAPGVAKRFGGPDKLQKALTEIQKLLYRTEEAA